MANREINGSKLVLKLKAIKNSRYRNRFHLMFVDYRGIIWSPALSQLDSDDDDNDKIVLYYFLSFFKASVV